jgi:hypothetical protein
MRDLGVSDNGAVLFVFLHLGVLEVLDEAVEALQTGVGQVADLNIDFGTF